MDRLISGNQGVSTSLPGMSVQPPAGFAQAGEHQIFPNVGSALTPEQQEQINRNREAARQRAAATAVHHESKIYGYIFTKNYIILVSIMILISLLVFTAIIGVEMGGNSPIKNKPLNARWQ